MQFRDWIHRIYGKGGVPLLDGQRANARAGSASLAFYCFAFSIDVRGDGQGNATFLLILMSCYRRWHEEFSTIVGKTDVCADLRVVAEMWLGVVKGGWPRGDVMRTQVRLICGCSCVCVCVLFCACGLLRLAG